MAVAIAKDKSMLRRCCLNLYQKDIAISNAAKSQYARELAAVRLLPVTEHSRKLENVHGLYTTKFSCKMQHKIHQQLDTQVRKTDIQIPAYPSFHMVSSNLHSYTGPLIPPSSSARYLDQTIAL